ncbi:14366_t:CDS:1 [Dentiscutata heterogama]|uniref:14366_t:CDS:1 n=1 Tax=Dentiscutata heterogama TaxID=1316150 RepID=A0ACA9KR11_9GLOM|nr:14366_t:CDS:1 [Dentiscutata heterogama]
MNQSGIPQSCYENSLNNELFSSSPYQLTLEINKLISPPQNTRKAKKFLKNPQSASPPRPSNAFILFRRDFFEKQKRNGTKMKLNDMSREAKNVWDNLSNEAKSYFDVLATWAKKRHDELYPNYKYDPKPKKPRSKVTHRKNNKAERFSTISYEKTCKTTIEESEKNPKTSIENSSNFELPFFPDLGIISYPFGLRNDFAIDDFLLYPYVSESINNVVTEQKFFNDLPSYPEYGFEPINNSELQANDQGFFVDNREYVFGPIEYQTTDQNFFNQYFVDYREYVFDSIEHQTTDQNFDHYINYDQQPGANC